MIHVAQILQLQKSKVEEWHGKMSLTEESLPWIYIEENHHFNFSLWHEEDIARLVNSEPQQIVSCKRKIDKYNQLRNNAMEKIDEWVLNYLLNNGKISPGNLHSETPGMMIDRLSIMTLKHYHMKEETLRADASNEHKKICKQKVEILEEQLEDLATCLEILFSKIKEGKVYFKVYRQLKMYNNPSLNPQLYSKK